MDGVLRWLLCLHSECAYQRLHRCSLSSQICKVHGHVLRCLHKPLRPGQPFRIAVPCSHKNLFLIRMGPNIVVHMRLPIRWPRLAIIFLLNCQQDKFAAWYAIKCSSFTSINRGTSQRSACSSLGDSSKPSVRSSNLLLERTACA